MNRSKLRKVALKIVFYCNFAQNMRLYGIRRNPSENAWLSTKLFGVFDFKKLQWSPSSFLLTFL